MLTATNYDNDELKVVLFLECRKTLVFSGYLVRSILKRLLISGMGFVRSWTSRNVGHALGQGRFGSSGQARIIL